jgi:hypothetical protein
VPKANEHAMIDTRLKVFRKSRQEMAYSYSLAEIINKVNQLNTVNTINHLEF